MQKALEQHWAVGSLGYPARRARAPIARASPLSRTQAVSSPFFLTIVQPFLIYWGGLFEDTHTQAVLPRG